MTLWRLLLTTDPTFYLSGLSFVRLGHKAEAIEEFKQAIAIDPTYALAYFDWGLSLYDLGNMKEAIEKYREGLALDDKDADAYNNLGLIQSELGEYESAITSFKRAIALNPQHKSAYSGWGKVLAKMGDQKGAEEKFKESGKISVDEDGKDIATTVEGSNAKAATAHVTVGSVYSKRGDSSTAKSYYGQARKIDRNYGTSSDSLEPEKKK